MCSNRSWCKKIVVGAERIKYEKNSADEIIKRMEHDISHIKDIGDIIEFFFNSRIYTNQSFINTLYGQQRKTTRSQDAGCSGTRDTLTISASGKEKLVKIQTEEHIIQMLTKALT